MLSLGLCFPDLHVPSFVTTASFSERPGFKYLPRDRQFELKRLVIFLSPFSQMPG
jgi:hypothetical protein